MKWLRKMFWKMFNWEKRNEARINSIEASLDDIKHSLAGIDVITEKISERLKNSPDLGELKKCVLKIKEDVEKIIKQF